jgi:AcrR family transcriptional regulator
MKWELKVLIDKKADIFKAAREVFYTKGFKDTNISEIAKKAGIGVGTFYNYFESKEKLFLEVYIKENKDLKMRLISSVDFNDDPVTFVTKFITLNLDEMSSNKILKEWYNKELFVKLEQYFTEIDEMDNINELMVDGKVELIRNWKAEGKLRSDIDDGMIIAIFNSIPYIDIHKNDIGIEYFPQIIKHITEFIMKGLTNCPN